MIFTAAFELLYILMAIFLFSVPQLFPRYHSSKFFFYHFVLGRPSKKRHEISDICQISVTLPTLYPDMDIKKFRHIFYTLTYLPIRKIWTKWK